MAKSAARSAVAHTRLQVSVIARTEAGDFVPGFRIAEGGDVLIVGAPAAGDQITAEQFDAWLASGSAGLIEAEAPPADPAAE